MQNCSKQKSEISILPAGVSRLLLVLNLCFFLAFPLHDGPVMGVDTAGYINMVSMREALYPLFLAFFRKAAEFIGLGTFTLYGQPFYLFPAVLFQCALAAVVTWRFSLLAADLAAEYGTSKMRLTGRSANTAKNTAKDTARNIKKTENDAEEQVYRNDRFGRPALFAYIATLCQWGSVVLQRFGSKRGACYQEVLLTEGLALSFYLMFLICLVRIALKLIRTSPTITAASSAASGTVDRAGGESIGSDERRNVESAADRLTAGDFLRLGITVFLCVSIRKQLFVTVLIAAAATFFFILFMLTGKVIGKKTDGTSKGASYDVSAARNGIGAENEKTAKSKGNERSVLFSWLVPLIISLAAAVLLSNGCERIYNYALYGVAATHTGSSMGLDCTLIYISDEEDAAAFEDPEIGEVFTEIRRQAAEQNVVWDDANYGDWYQMFYHYSESYDVIGYGIMNPVIREYLAGRYDISSMNDLEYNMLVDEVEAKIKSTLLTRHIGKYFYIWYVNFRQGFAVSVLKSHPILNYLIVLMYAAYFGMWFRLLYVVRKGKTKSEVGKTGQHAEVLTAGECRLAVMQNVLLFAFLSMMGLVINNAVVSAMIYNQTRYAIYVMSSFYTALLLMMVEMPEPRGEHGRENLL